MALMTLSYRRRNFSGLNGIWVIVTTWHGSKWWRMMMNHSGIWVTLSMMMTMMWLMMYLIIRVMMTMMLLMMYLLILMLMMTMSMMMMMQCMVYLTLTFTCPWQHLSDLNGILSDLNGTCPRQHFNDRLDVVNLWQNISYCI